MMHGYCWFNRVILRYISKEILYVCTNSTMNQIKGVKQLCIIAGLLQRDIILGRSVCLYPAAIGISTYFGWWKKIQNYFKFKNFSI